MYPRSSTKTKTSSTRTITTTTRVISNNGSAAGSVVRRSAGASTRNSVRSGVATVTATNTSSLRAAATRTKYANVQPRVPVSVRTTVNQAIKQTQQQAVIEIPRKHSPDMQADLMESQAEHNTEVAVAQSTAATTPRQKTSKRQTAGSSAARAKTSRKPSLPPGEPPAARIWNRAEHSKPQPPPSPRVKLVSEKRESAEPQTPHSEDLAIQTDEREILNQELLMDGDESIKFLLPSEQLVVQIDRLRRERRKKQALQARREASEHEKRQMEHTDNLREFLDTGAVSKKSRKVVDAQRALEKDRKLIQQMDEILNRAVQRTESFSNIRGRIKQKENELMSLLNKVDQIKEQMPASVTAAATEEQTN